MKEFEKMDKYEKDYIETLFVNWLKYYTHEVICSVLKKRDEIINNEFAMNLLKELDSREFEERHEFKRNISNMLNDFETFSQYDPHNHALTHAGSYRDILYDMYIR